ncbi:hypothetical protein CALCODRAFT_513641, partial [Calocera cornea HHB12733]
ALKGEHNALKGEHNALKNEHNALKNKHDTLKNKHDTLKNEHDTLKKLKSEVEKERDGLEETRKRLEEEKTRMEGLVARWDDERKKLEESLQEKEETNKNLRVQVSDLEAALISTEGAEDGQGEDEVEDGEGEDETGPQSESWRSAEIEPVETRGSKAARRDISERVSLARQRLGCTPFSRKMPPSDVLDYLAKLDIVETEPGKLYKAMDKYLRDGEHCAELAWVGVNDLLTEVGVGTRIRKYCAFEMRWIEEQSWVAPGNQQWVHPTERLQKEMQRALELRFEENREMAVTQMKQVEAALLEYSRTYNKFISVLHVGLMLSKWCMEGILLCQRRVCGRRTGSRLNDFAGQEDWFEVERLGVQQLCAI